VIPFKNMKLQLQVSVVRVDHTAIIIAEVTHSIEREKEKYEL